jgi:hypothetical protein
VASIVLSVALAALLADLITTGNRQAAERRRDEAAFAQAKVARLTEDQRPRRAGLAQGAAVAPALERAVTADVRDRVRAGLLEGPVRGTQCTLIGDTGGAAYHCFTLSRRSATTRTLENGYRFSAKVNPAAGTLTWCKRNPRPLHPDTASFLELPVSKDCLP